MTREDNAAGDLVDQAAGGNRLALRRGRGGRLRSRGLADVLEPTRPEPAPLSRDPAGERE